MASPPSRKRRLISCITAHSANISSTAAATSASNASPPKRTAASATAISTAPVTMRAPRPLPPAIALAPAKAPLPGREFGHRLGQRRTVEVGP